MLDRRSHAEVWSSHFGLLLTVATLAVEHRSESNAGAWLSTFALSSDLANRSSQLIVQIKKKKNKHGGSTEGEHACPPGYVVLDKPNKYGAYCEPKEGLPKTPAEEEAEKCKFPGQIGKAPNCTCPDGTEFLGFKGCVKFTTQQYCSDNNQPGDRLLNKDELAPFGDKCKSQYKGLPSCAHLFHGRARAVPVLLLLPAVCQLIYSRQQSDGVLHGIKTASG